DHPRRWGRVHHGLRLPPRNSERLKTRASEQGSGAAGGSHALARRRSLPALGARQARYSPGELAEGRPMDGMSFSLQSWLRPLAKVGGVVFGVAALAVPAFAQTRTDLVERGRYLVETIGVCGHCHTPQQVKDGRQVDLPGMHLAGGYGFDGPVLGRWVGANITSDPETGIGGWTEVQIATAIREGRRPNGSIIGPPMPFAHYRKISDADAAAMAAY